MFENNLGEGKIGLTVEVNKFLHNYEAVEQAISMFEGSSKIELPKNGEIILRS